VLSITDLGANMNNFDDSHISCIFFGCAVVSSGLTISFTSFMSQPALAATIQKESQLNEFAIDNNHAQVKADFTFDAHPSDKEAVNRVVQVGKKSLLNQRILTMYITREEMDWQLSV
jgi:hypothetical protein